MSPIRLDRATHARRLPNGLELHTAQATLRITALTDGILRLQAIPAGIASPPASSAVASWAVLPKIRQASIPVTHTGDHPPAFTTADLHVTATLDPLHLSITDPAGHILLDDAAGQPTTFTGAAFRTWKRSPPDAFYFGLGDKPGRLHRNGRSFRMWNTDDPLWSESSDLLYKTIPFILTLRQGRSCGLFLDNTSRSVFDFGVSSPDTLCFGAESGPLDLYVLAGPDPKSVLQRYITLTGPAPLPPLWALGYQQSRYSYETQERVRQIADEHRARRLPLDAIWLDIGYQDRNRPFTVDKTAFPDLAAMTSTLRETGIHTVAITDLHIAHAPDQDYPPYDTGSAGDHFLRNPDGTLFIGESWPGQAVFPDFAREDTKNWWGTLYRDFYLRDGIAGFWNDMNEPSVRNGPGKTMPLDVQHRINLPHHPERTAGHAEIHNAYGLQNTEATHQGLLTLNPERRPFVLTRASYAGGHRSAATWTGDNASTWQHLRLMVPQLLNLGLSGFALAGADVGGFGGSPTPDLLTRWIQLAAFTPFFRNHTALGTADQEAWVHGPDHETLRRQAIETRYRLLPYLYTLAEEASRTGTPIMRPMFMEFPNAGLETHATQFLFGPALLIAPWPDETIDPYELDLPPDTTWYDYWTGLKLDTPADITLRKRLDHLPVFARGGHIIPRQPLTQSTSETPDGPLTLHVYPGPEATGSIYIDDGTSLSYRGGAYFRQIFTLSAEPGRLHLHLASAEGHWKPWWQQIEVITHGMDRPPLHVTADRRTLSSTSYNPAARTLVFHIDPQVQGVEVRLS